MELQNSSRKILGLIVNPVAGMGGSVGLKGTDGDLHKKAKKMGAEPVTPKRTLEFLTHMKSKDMIYMLVAPGGMGDDCVKTFTFPITVIGEISEETSAEDTKRIARQMIDCGAEMLIFVGGDGTARDIYDAIGTKIPVVAVPAGVKVFSSVFAVSPRAAAEMVDAFIEGTNFTEEEVLDIDEDAFREDRLASRLYGYLVVPEIRKFLQPGKATSNISRSSEESKADIADYIIELMDSESLFILGPGTTVKAIIKGMELPYTLLGIDAVHDQQLVGKDINEKAILHLFEQYPQRKIIVTPIGGNGFIFGRGSKQFTPEVIKRVGKENIIVVGTREKLSHLEVLRVDTGDFELDELLIGYLKVWIGTREAIVRKVIC